MSILRALARPLLATPFIVSGIDALIRPANHRERAENVAPLLDKAGYPLTEKQMDHATRAFGLTNVLCGAALAVGKFPRFSALVLAATEVPVSLANNPVWLHKGPERRKDILGLTESAGLLGGVLLAASDLAGKPSRSWRRSYKHDLRKEIEAVRTHERALAQARIAKLENKVKAS